VGFYDITINNYYFPNYNSLNGLYNASRLYSLSGILLCKSLESFRHTCLVARTFNVSFTVRQRRNKHVFTFSYGYVIN
jgi:hypothetical protein